MKTLVIGGAGYVGSVLTERLVGRGFDVKIFDNFLFGTEGLNNVRDRIELVKGDMRTPPEDLFKNIESVICLGGYSNDPMAEFDRKRNFELNRDAVLKCAGISKKLGVKKFVYASTCSIYDVSELNEDVEFTETSKVNPTSSYGQSKHEAEKGLNRLADKNFEIAILRKGTVFGWSPRMRYDLVVNTFVKDGLAKGWISLFNGGEIWRPLIHIKDAADAYIQAISSDFKGTVNIAYDNYRISEVAMRVYDIFKSHNLPLDFNLQYSNMPVRNYRVNTDKMRNKLGFKPRIGIQEGAAEILEKSKEINTSRPLYYNIEWLKLVRKIQSEIGNREV